MASTKLQTDDGTIQACVRDCLARDNESRTCRTSYLRLLIGALQVALGSSPRLVGARGRARQVAMPEALEALSRVNERFYGIVLAEIPHDLDALTRNKQSGFARSAASTLRSAIRAGLNPLELVVVSATKDSLRAWTAEHKPEETVTLKAAMSRAHAIAKRVRTLIGNLSETEKADVLEALRRDLEAVEAEIVRPRFAKAA
jgi:hypothetical protein